jgi:predicted HicB family RNase H-like nuclease
MLEYKGYIAKVDFEEDDEYMNGEVINVRDVITFKGKNIKELKHELKNSVECYLDFCKKKNREPEKPFSGKFIVRVLPDLHRELYVLAKIHGVSLNKYIALVLENSLTRKLQK